MTSMTDTERIKEITKLQAELNAEEAAHAAKVQAIREQINALCGIGTGETYKQRRNTLSRTDFKAACGF